MARRRLRGIRPAIDRLGAHAFHQRPDMLAADLEAFLDQQALQHSTACKGMIRVQAVDPLHQLQVGVADWSGPVIDGTPTEP